MCLAKGAELLRSAAEKDMMQMQWFARLCCVKQASNWGWKSHVEVGDREPLPTRLGQPH